jgi:3'-phosphoadenosine 5'-phosphosulfate sulfotransferase (PAPS reductase)/FAD synthetase
MENNQRREELSFYYFTGGGKITSLNLYEELMEYVIFASYGNDSIALIQWAKDKGLKNVTVLFSDTGWAASYWRERVKSAEAWVACLGFNFARTESIGMENLVKSVGMWPRQGIQFCTLDLKIKPALEWLEKYDPEKKAVCMVGVRREEGTNRRNFPEIVEESPNHGGRKCWAPLVDFHEIERNELIYKAGFEPLPHRSMECFPCINSNRNDLKLLASDEARILEIERIEKEMGFTKTTNKPKTMFRPYRHMGATGIRQVVKWALSKRGKFSLDDGTGQECESGFCGI